jgi:hypothetical protein
MLHTAVHPLKELRQVRVTASLLKVHTKKDLDYEAYSSILLSTASVYDSKQGCSTGKRQAHDLDHGDEDLYHASYKMDPLILIPLLTPYKLFLPSSHLVQV